MAKRRLITQLPVVHQTQTLQKFFSTTVDQVFQPGETQSINALIGRKPQYFDAKRDFYKQEINSERSFYQLETAMTSTPAGSTTPSDLLFYQDLVNNLRFQGANVDNHERLFESDQYSWCPPINVHKLNNYRDYYWMPDGPPVLVLEIPTVSYTGDGITTVYALPKAVPDAQLNMMVRINGIEIDAINLLDGGDWESVEEDVIDGDILDGTIDGNLDEGYTIVGNNIVFNGPLDSGDILEIYLNANFIQNIQGKANYKHTLPAKAYAEQTKDNLDGTTTLVTFPTIDIQTPPYLQDGMRVRIIDNTGDNLYVVSRDSQNNLNLQVLKPQLQERTPMYWCIERNSYNQNSFSRRNAWYHKDFLFYTDTQYNPSQANRPIIEFNKDLKLTNHGINALQDVNLVWTSGNPYTLNTPVNGTLPNLLDIPWLGLPTFTTNVTHDVGILVENSSIPSLRNGILRGELQVEFGEYDGLDPLDSMLSNWDADGNEYWEVGVTIPGAFTIETPQQDDTVLVAEQPHELWFDNGEWKIAQYFDPSTRNQPLFDMYDRDGVSFAKYAHVTTTFQGCKIFAYKEGTNVDTVLNIGVSRNKYGNIQFTDHTAVDTFTYDNGVLKGLKFYGEVKGGEIQYGSVWQPAGTSVQAKRDGFFEVPANLQANALNKAIETVSANEWTDQFKPIIENNNWNYNSEFRDNTLGRRIMQNRSPLLKLMLMNSSATLDFQKAAMYNEREYIRYRNRFAQLVVNTAQTQGIDDPQLVLGRILNTLKSAKTIDFPFFNNGIIGEYFIPASASYLGMAPLWKPQYVVENGRSGPVLLLRGHDGSLLPCAAKYNADLQDFEYTKRDAVMLAFETALYDSTKDVLRSQRRPLFDLKAYQPGKFRTTDYTREEYLDISRPLFERWVSQNNYVYRENNNYDSSNVLTWNYSSRRDIDGAPLPGHWRGIYRWFFDTERPHTHPWEMLGWTTKPEMETHNWAWDDFYAWDDPFKRQALIDAICDGLVNPVTNEYDPVFAREREIKDENGNVIRVESFRNVCPVDESGNLLNPFEANILLDNGVYDYDNDWEFGDGAAIESMWLNSYVTSFAIAQLGYLTKPARFVESNWITGDQTLVQGSQWISQLTGDRSVDAKAVVHNEIVNDKAVPVLGLQTWISDHLRSQGMDVTAAFGDKVRALNVNLSHKLGGFVDASSLKAFTENTGLIPQEDVLLALYRSPSIKEEFYGGVIVEWTGDSWRVIGYDVVDAVFNILPVNTTGDRLKLSLDNTPDTVVDWLANTYYQVGVLVKYRGTNYRCIKTHTSGREFEVEFWQAEAITASTPSGSVVWYLEHEAEKQTVPYGTEFYSRQELADFMSGYQAYLESRGWVFDNYDADLNIVNDFKQSTLEFMQWSQVAWETGTFIALSPCAGSVKFTSKHGTIQNVEQIVHGVYSLLDKSGSSIAKNTVTTNRLDHEITVGVTEGGIYGLRVFVSEVEQVVVFNNQTIFGNVIYDALYNVRQARLRMLALISTEWAGRLDAPGFIVTENRLVPSFDRQVEDIRYMYDIEKPINLPLRDNARHQVGFQGRDYLENLMFNEVNQFEFYQGMIQQKGAPGVFSKLLRNDKLTTTAQLNFLEEWAFRKGVYGGTDTNEVFEFELMKTDVKSEPQMIEFVESSDYDFTEKIYNPEDANMASKWDINEPHSNIDPDLLGEMDNKTDDVIRLYKYQDSYERRWITPFKQNAFTVIDDFKKSKGALPTPGYVRVDEVQWNARTMSSLSSIIANSDSEPQTGERVWLYDNGESTWDVYRVRMQHPVVGFVPDALGTQLILSTAVIYQVNDIIYLNKQINLDAEISGIYRVLAVSDDRRVITIEAMVQGEKYYDDVAEELLPTVARLESVRVSSNDANFAPMLQSATLELADLGLTGRIYEKGELLYVDACYEFVNQDQLSASVPRWGVYRWNGSKFELFRKQPSKLRRDLIRDIKVYDTRSTRSGRTLNAKPLLYQDIVVYDPSQGLIPGVAEREIWYQIEKDPAYYNSDADTDVGMEWGESQVGRLWWDVSTSYYLASETDTERDGELTEEEKRYRSMNWGKLAPDSSVDIWEWTKSYVSPIAWQDAVTKGKDTQTYDGDILNPDAPRWVESSEWDDRLGKEIPVYYFWVRNRKQIPAQKNFRKLSAQSVAQLIENPTAAGIAWVSPLTANSVLVSGIAQFLNATSSLQFTVARSEAKTPKHVEWQILRAGDERSIPGQDLWNKLVLSLSARDAEGVEYPNSNLYYTDRVGFDVDRGQNMFRDVKAARKHVVQKINTVLSKQLIADYRRDASVLNEADGDEQLMLWTQNTSSYYVRPLPQSQFITAMAPDHADAQAMLAGNTKGNYMAYRLRGDNPFWAVYTTDSNGNLTIAKLYDKVVDSMTALNVTAKTPGVKVMVRGNAATGNFWTIWTPNSALTQWTLVQTQRYNSADAWSYVDWYAEGYSAVTPPTTVFANALDRDAQLGVDAPEILFVKLNDDGKGRWEWVEYQDGEWKVVAKQNGTIKLSDKIWQNYGNFLDVSGALPSDFKAQVEGRDMGWELNKILNSLREEILTNLEVNDLFFSLVNYAHTEQDYVDWCFKTSFMYVTGYKNVLGQDPIAFVDPTENLLKYIQEVKPYHVKVRDFVSKYGVQDEIANVRAVDFDKPAYFDVKLGKYRVLDENIAADLAIMQKGMWQHWYNQWKNEDNNKVRKLNINLQYGETVHAKVTEDLKIRVYRMDGIDTNPYSNFDNETSPWDESEYDYDTTATTAQYAADHNLDLPTYGIMQYEDFSWDEPMGPVRTLAVRYANGEITTDKVVFTVNTDFTAKPWVYEQWITNDKQTTAITNANATKGWQATGALTTSQVSATPSDSDGYVPL